VMKLWREHYAPYRVALEGDSEGLNSVATKSQDGRTVYLKCVNPKPEAAEVSLRLAGEAIPAGGTMRIVAPGSLEARNTLARPHTVRPETGGLRIEEGTVRCTVPALSAVVITLQL